MNVAELIELLKQMPSDATVVSEGYETGYEPIKKVEIIKVAENHSPEWWDGKFEKTDESTALEVVFLNTENRTYK